MKILRGLHISRANIGKLARLDRAILKIGPRFLTEGIKFQNLPDSHLVFQTDSPYMSLHFPTPYGDLLEYLGQSLTNENGRIYAKVTHCASAFQLGQDKVEIPEGSKVSVPGFGMGMAGSVFALLERRSGKPIFDKTVGIEIDPRIAEAARHLMRSFEIPNVEVQTGDMKDADYKGFKAIYFFYPSINDDFMPLIHPVLDKSDPGTLFFLLDNPYVQEMFFNDKFLPLQTNMPVPIRGCEFWAFIKKPVNQTV